MPETSISVRNSAGDIKTILTHEGALAPLLALLAPPSVGTFLTPVAAATSNTALSASSASRKGLVIVNDSTATLKIALGFTATATNYSEELGPGGRTVISGFTGAINGIWSSATGNARITELT